MVPRLPLNPPFVHVSVSLRQIKKCAVFPRNRSGSHSGSYNSAMYMGVKTPQQTQSVQIIDILLIITTNFPSAVTLMMLFASKEGR